MQNSSSAVMAQRHENALSLDDFPTPAWATRALLEIGEIKCEWQSMSCLEPACGRGTMSKPLSEYFGSVISSDIHDYGFGDKLDFLSHDTPYGRDSFDWVITNPPFKNAQSFIERANQISRVGTAVLCRTVFIESIGRYNSLFSVFPPTFVAQFAERVPMVRGRLDEKATTATGYAWLIWDKRVEVDGTRLIWVPPCRKKLTKKGDYEFAANSKPAQQADLLQSAL